MLLRIKALIIFALAMTFAKAQEADSAYLNYLEQFTQFLNSRSYTASETANTLLEFRKHQLLSNEGLARLSEKLYPKDQQIAIMLYFFHKDTLRRTLFEPGRIIEETSIPLKKEALLQLGEDLNQALNLYQLTGNRAPKPRGNVVLKKNGAKHHPDLNKITKELTTLLLPGKFSEKYKHLIVIPSLNIGTLPFHLLKPYQDGSYLIDKCSFTVAPTLVDFVILRSKVLDFLSGRGAKGLMSISSDYDNAVRSNTIAHPENVTFDITKAVFVCNPVYPQNREYSFPDLPGAVKEVDSALLHVKNYTLFKGKEAIKDSIIKALNNASIGYFATHGISSPENPKDKSYLVLSGDDPFLTSKEIMDLRLREGFTMPMLVILSACQTGLGQTMEAGVSGSLARSFILSGSEQVIMSLWSVDDNATAMLMSRFIYYLKNGRSFMPAEHLRQAILDTKKRYPNPAHWASFSLIGVDYNL